MARKPITNSSPLALHYSDFLGQLILRDIGSKSGRQMGPLKGRSGTYWVEHAFEGTWGDPKPLALADLVFIAESYNIDPYDFVAAVNSNNLEAVPRLGRLYVVRQTEHEEQRSIPDTETEMPDAVAAKSNRGRKREDQGASEGS